MVAGLAAGCNHARLAVLEGGMTTRREWIMGAGALCAMVATTAQAADRGEVISELTAMTDASYVDPKFNGPHFVYNRSQSYKVAKSMAEGGRSSGQNNLGVLLILGNGVDKDTAAGFAWIEKAAAQNEAEAIRNLGECYRFGLGVEKDAVKARDLLLKALLLTSYTSLGFMYATGEGGPPNLETAVFLFAKDGDYGQYLGAHEAGLHIAIGRGAAQSLPKAWRYFKIADRDGRIPEATGARTLLESVMTEAELAEAQKLYKTWRKKGIS